MAIVDVLNDLQVFGFTDILLWLLTFAVVYGVLSHAGEKGTPKSQASRAIIALVAAFFVLLAAPTQLATVVSKQVTALILVVIGIMVLIVFLEVANVRFLHETEVEHEGKKKKMITEISAQQRFAHIFAIVLVAVAVIVFITSGGLSLIGLERVTFPPAAVGSLIILVLVIAAVAWLIASGGRTG